ncbi:MAG: flavodoxin domain-containing protein [Candidatus Helarchaeota archaeon]
MPKKQILIAYATRYGSTEETAKELVKIFKEHEIKTDLLNLKQIKEKKWPLLDNYDGIIVASGIKIGKWTKEALKFLKIFNNKFKSNKKILGLFVSCTTCLTDPKKANNEYLNQIIENLEIKPNLYYTFGPILDFSESSRIGRIAKAILKKVTEKDFELAGINVDYNGRNDLRDKNKIREFAEKFISLVKK